MIYNLKRGIADWFLCSFYTRFFYVQLGISEQVKYLLSNEKKKSNIDGTFILKSPKHYLLN